MKECSDSRKRKDFTREEIIGLGDASFRKNYYTELQERLLELERINTRNRALLATIPDYLLVDSEDGDIRLFGEPSNLRNDNITELLRDEDIMNRLRNAAKSVRSTRKMISYHFSHQVHEEIYYFEARVNRSEFDEVLIIIRDTTEQMRMEMKLREMAEQDSLTKLYNRHFFMDHLQRFEGKPTGNFAVLLIDIDGLKLVNDTLGHSYGDTIIMAIGNILNTLYYNIGIVSRVGGDEFAVILSGYTQEEIERLLEQMRLMIDEYNDRTDIVKISVSSGYSYLKEGIAKTNAMYQEADNNMYQNKLLKEASNRNSLVKALMKTLEVKDYITEGHADRLQDLSLSMAKALKLPQHQVDRIKLLARFHDIGKVGIPDRILLKPSRLTEEELAVMKTHSNIGKRIAEASSELKDISSLIFHHHERIDGKGYPLGLKGREIPVECRILSIVDTYDAITNDRPYRKALSAEAAIAEIVHCSGTQFDPELVDVFIRLVAIDPGMF